MATIVAHCGRRDKGGFCPVRRRSWPSQGSSRAKDPFARSPGLEASCLFGREMTAYIQRRGGWPIVATASQDSGESSRALERDGRSPRRRSGSWAPREVAGAPTGPGRAPPTRHCGPARDGPGAATARWRSRPSSRSSHCSARSGSGCSAVPRRRSTRRRKRSPASHPRCTVLRVHRRLRGHDSRRYVPPIRPAWLRRLAVRRGTGGPRPVTGWDQARVRLARDAPGAGADSGVRILDLRTGEVTTLPRQSLYDEPALLLAWNLRWSPDGRYLGNRVTTVGAFDSGAWASGPHWSAGWFDPTSRRLLLEPEGVGRSLVVVEPPTATTVLYTSQARHGPRGADQPAGLAGGPTRAGDGAPRDRSGRAGTRRRPRHRGVPQRTSSMTLPSSTGSRNPGGRRTRLQPARPLVRGRPCLRRPGCWVSEPRSGSP